MTRAQRLFLSILVAWQLTLTLFLTLAGARDRRLAALAGMLWGMDMLWIGGAGWLSIRLGEACRSRFRRSLRGGGGRFVLLATMMALIEEAIATAMTNSAPAFGVPLGTVFITASGNYLDVISFHSVVVFLPEFAAWAWLLSRYRFAPFSVFVLFGITGLIGEFMFAGPQPLTVAQWLLIYGLMVYLPACCYPDLPDRRPIRPWTYLAAVGLPLLAAMLVSLLLIKIIAVDHPRIHFSPPVPMEHRTAEPTRSP